MRHLQEDCDPVAALHTVLIGVTIPYLVPALPNVELLCLDCSISGLASE